MMNLRTPALLLLFAGSLSLAVVSAEDEIRNPYLAADDLSPAELVEYLDKMSDKPKTIQRRRAFQAALVDAARRIAEAKDGVTDQQRQDALLQQFRGLYFLSTAGNEKSRQQLEALAEKSKESQQSAIAQEAAVVLMEKRVREVDFDNAEELAKTLAAIKEVLEKQEALGERHLELASGAVSIINKLDNELKAAEAYLAFGDMFVKSENDELRRYGKSIQKFGKKLDLLAKPVELKGKLLDGSDLDWSNYKGKVVLIDFWATWCGPCVAEMPNIKEVYQKYHEQGFEVIGISLDKEVDAAKAFFEKQEIPWKTVIGHDDETRGPKHPMVEKFGIRSIPTMILLGRDGKIAAVNARGEKLEPQVKKLLEKKPEPQKVKVRRLQK